MPQINEKFCKMRLRHSELPGWPFPAAYTGFVSHSGHQDEQSTAGR
jgi:hypothetical protein